MYSSFDSLDRFIPRYFILFIAMVNQFSYLRILVVWNFKLFYPPLSAYEQWKVSMSTSRLCFIFFPVFFLGLPKLSWSHLFNSPEWASQPASHCNNCSCLVIQSGLTLCNPMDYSLPGSPVHGIFFQTRILGWVVISSRESFQPRDWTQVSCISCTAGGFFITESGR